MSKCFILFFYLKRDYHLSETVFGVYMDRMVAAMDLTFLKEDNPDRGFRVEEVPLDMRRSFITERTDA